MSVRVVGVFYLVSCLLCWGLLGLFHLAGGVYGSSWTVGVWFAYIWGPALGAYVAQQFIVRRHVPTGLGLATTPSAWILAGWLVPPLLGIAVFLLGGMLPGVELTLDPARLFERDLAQAPPLTPELLAEARKNVESASGAAVFLVTLTGGTFFGILAGFIALGGEVGWRGLALKELAPLRFWKASLLVGLLWGLWFAPLAVFGFNYPEHRGVVGAGMTLLWCMLVAPLAAFVRLRARSVLGSALFVGGLTASARLAERFSIGGDDLTRGMFGIPGLVVLAALNVVLIVRGVGEAEAELEQIAKT